MEGPRPDKFYKCFRIVKTQKTSRGCSAHIMGSPFAPNEVPAPVCAAALSGSLTESVRSWHSKVLITFNYKEGTQTVTFGEATEATSKGNGSDLDCIPALSSDSFQKGCRFSFASVLLETLCYADQRT